jgi:beta-lactamase regulating signal transducer with metallopeptidase domain
MNPLHTISDILRLPMSTPLWFVNLLSWSIQVALLAAVAALLPRLFRIRQPGILLAYWRVVLLISFALPLLQPWNHPRILKAMLVERDFVPVTLASPSAHAVSHWYVPSAELVAKMLGLVILVGFAVRLIIFGLGLWKLGQLRRTSLLVPVAADSFALLEQMGAQIQARAEFRLSADVESPVTFGFAAPVILLPERFLSLEPRFQNAIACHELLHVRRRDWAHHLAEEVVRAAFWFHPAITWLISRVRLAREQLVDLEVVRLTQTRKTYLEALLEFTGGRARIAAMPAPLFLAERQLVERVALMVKEVRMSRARLIASFVVITGCLALALMLGVWTFPLRGAPLPAQAPQTGVTGGVSEGVSGGVSGTVSAGISGGVAGGISGGVSGEVAKTQSGSEPTVAYDSIWVDTVKRGPMVRQVRGLGALVEDASGNLVARISLPDSITRDVRADQSAIVEPRRGDQNGTSSLPKQSATGRVIKVVPGAAGETHVDIELNASRQFLYNAGIQVEATIDIERIENVLHIGRPIHVTADSTLPVFKIVKDGTEAERVNVKFGRASVNTIEVLDGLQVGDKVILSDMSAYDNAERVRLTNEKSPH